MIQDNFFSNNSYGDFNINDDENSLFFINQNNDDNFSLKLENNPFQMHNYIEKDLSLISPIPIPNFGNDSESYKQQNNINSNNSNSNNVSNSSITKDKSLLKKMENNNIDINIINNNTNPIINLDEDKDINNNQKDNIDDNNNKKLLEKKRRPRKYLEDLNIDPEIIKEKRFIKIGDKVIRSKNQIITDEDRKEIRAIRNRVSAKKSRDKKKVEFINLIQKIELLTKQIEEKNVIINKYEKICCMQCKLKMAKINAKILEEDHNINNINMPVEYNAENDKKKKDFQKNEIPLDKKVKENKNNEKEELILEEQSFFSDKNNSFMGKISGFLIGIVVCLIGIVFCLYGGSAIINNRNNLNKEYQFSNSGTLRNLARNIDIDDNENINEDIDNNIDNNVNNNNNEIGNNNNAPVPIDTITNNFMQMCHDKFTWEIYTNLKNKKQLKNGNFLQKRNNKDLSLDKSICLENDNILNNNYIINNSNFYNNLPIEADNIFTNNNLSNKIISVFVKDYEALKRYVNGTSLPLQEQIETEAKNSEDGCVYLQMIIPRENSKNNFDNNDNYSDYNNGFFEIRCKIIAYNNYYDKFVANH